MILSGLTVTGINSNYMNSKNYNIDETNDYNDNFSIEITNDLLSISKNDNIEILPEEIEPDYNSNIEKPKEGIGLLGK